MNQIAYRMWYVVLVVVVIMPITGAIIARGQYGIGLLLITLQLPWVYTIAAKIEG